MADDLLELSTELAELSLVEGVRRNAPPEMGGAEGERGRLYVLVEVSAPADLWDEAGERLVAVATEAFRNTHGGVTKALNAAAEAANELLLYENTNALPDQQIWAGLNCVVIRGSDLFLGQAGPALTYISREGAVTKFPRSFDDLQTGAASSLTPLGESADIQVRLARFALKPNDLIALTASHLPTLAEPDEIYAALNGENAEDVADSLAEAVEGEDFSAMIIRIGQPVARRGAAPAPPVPIRKSAQRRRQEPAVPKAPEPERERDAWWYGKTTPSEPAQSPPPADSSVPARPETGRGTGRSQVPPRSETSYLRPDESDTGRPDQAHAIVPASRSRVYDQHPLPPVPARNSSRARTGTGGTRTAAGAVLGVLAAVVGALARALRWSQQTLGPRIRQAAPVVNRISELLARAGRRVGVWLKALVGQMLPADNAPAPGQAKPARQPTRARPGQARSMWPPIFIGIFVAAFALTAVLVWRQRPPATSAYAEHTTAAAEYLNQAEVAPPTEAPALVAQAQDEIEAAAAIEPDNPELREMRQRGQAVLDRTLNLTRVTPTKLAALAQPSQPVNIAVNGGDLYVLDLQAGAVYRLSTTEPIEGTLGSDRAILQDGQTLGDGTLGRPQFLTWMPPGNGREHAGLVALTSIGQVVEYDPQAATVRILPFAPVDARVVAMEPYEGNLYLLDREHKQVWKYVPSADGGYADPPSSWILPETSEALAPPLQFAIDGDIYVLQDGGQVAKLNGGEFRDFTLPAVEPPLAGATAIGTEPPESTDLFLGDGERVLRLSKSGQLLAQYHPPLEESWGTIRDLAVDTNAGVLYLLTTDGVYRVAYGSAAPPEAPPAETPVPGE